MKYCLIILFFFISTVAISQPKKYYFSSAGNDANTAVQAQNPTTPWKTIAKLDAFWSSLVVGDSVLFNRGEVFPGTITPTKSGTSATSIFVGAYGTGANPIVGGGTILNTWTNDGGGIFSTPLTTAPSILTIAGIQFVQGRTPNTGWLTITSTNGSSNITNAALIGSYVGASVVYKENRSVIDNKPITGQAGTTISFAAGSVTANFGFFIMNQLATLDQYGEWFYSTSTQRLSVFFGGSSTAPVTVANQNNAISITNQSFINFSNIDLRYSNSHLVVLSGANNITFSGCNLKFSGARGVQATNCNNFQFLNSTARNLNDVGIEFNGSNAAPQILNSIVNNAGSFAGLGGNSFDNYCGIVTNNSCPNMNFTGNEVDTCGYQGITGGATNSLVKNNFVNYTNYLKDDGGGIYIQSNSGVGKRITGNIVLNSIGAPEGTNNATRQAMGIYSDGGNINTEIDNNSVAFCGATGIYMDNGVGINIHNNTVYNGTNFEIGIDYTGCCGAMTGLRITKNLCANNTTTAIVFAPQNQSTGPSISTWGVIDSNVYARPLADNTTIRTWTGSGAAQNLTLVGWRPLYNYDLHSTISPKTETTASQIQFIYNRTNSPVINPLVGTWIDLNNVSYPSSITLAPFTSAILLFSTNSGALLSATSSALVNPLLCFGNSTTGTVNATGGTPPYQFKIGAGSFQAGNTFPALTPNTYIFTVKDAANTQVTTSLTITSPPAITISQTSGTITINGNTTSTVVAAGGGTPPYQYRLDGSALQNSATFTGVGAGPHTITVQDSHACTNTLAYTLTQPAAISLSLAATTNPLLCFGNLTTITATTTGGTTPYSYTINGGSPQSSNIFTNLGAGTYQVTVTDFAGAVTSKTLVITQPAQIIITETHTTIAVNGGSSTVTFVATNGVGTKTYILDGITTQTSPIFSGVLADTHTVVVRDANLCQNIFTFTILQPSSLLVSASITTAIPCNNGVGSITGNASGGTIPYDYQLNGGTRQSSPIFNNLPTGTYTLTVNDGGGAVVSASPLTLTQPAPIIINVNAGASAPATVTVTITSGGIAPFTYKLDTGTPQGTGTFLNVTAGNHTILVTDSHSCTTSQLFTIGSSLSITLSVGAIACNGGFTSATVTPIGGTFPYTYLWSDGRQVSPNPNISAGTWNVKVTDNAGHSHDTTFVVTQPPTVTISLSIGTIVVNGGTAAVTVTAGGGSGSGYTYNLDSTSYGGSNSFPTVSAGNHFILVKDGNGCVKRQDFSMSQPGRLVITISRGAAILCPGGTQTITVGSTGGSGTVIGTGAFPTLAGTVTFSIHDQFSTADTQILITQPTPLTLSVAFTAILVSGGTSTVTGTGGGGTPALTYSLDSGSYQSSPIFSGVLAGHHFMIVKDSHNCTLRNDFSIPQPDPLQVAISIGTNPLLCNGNTTTVTITPSKGTPPYTITGGSPQTLGSGTYHAHVVDQFGATFDSIFQINAPSLIVLLGTVPQGTIATYGGTVDVLIQNAGGTPINDSLYQYSLDGGSFVTSDSAFSYILTAVTGDNHTIGIKDANGCTKIFPFVVPQPSPPAQFMNRSKRQKHIYRKG